MKKTLLAALAVGVLMVGMVGGANAAAITGHYDSISASNSAGLDYSILVNGDGTVTFNLIPILQTSSIEAIEHAMTPLSMALSRKIGHFRPTI